MGVSERKLREKEQRRLDIIYAAEKVFFSKSINSATVDDVAEAAELSKGTLYLYFKNKEELVAAVFHRGMSILHQMMLDTIKQTSSPIAQLRLLGTTYLEFARKYPDHFALMLEKELHKLQIDDSTPESHACLDEGIRVLKLLAKTVEDGISQREIRSDILPSHLALIIWGQIHGIIAIASQEEECLMHDFVEFDLKSLVTSTIDIIIQGIKAKSSD